TDPSAAPRAVPSRRTAESAHPTEHRVEEIREVSGLAAERVRAGCAVVDPAKVPVAALRVRTGVRVALPVRAKLVVPLALLGVAQHLVRLVQLLELLRGVGRLAHIRVVLPCELAVRLLDVGGRRA